MPALITHRLFGEESINMLPEGLIESSTDRMAFMLGNQGPDPFFFNYIHPNGQQARRFASIMHSTQPTRAFKVLYDGVAHTHPKHSSCARAFALGMLAHYVLDRCAHPFVYAQQFELETLDPSLKDVHSQVHAIIESDIDVLILQTKCNGATTAKYPPLSTIGTTAQINLVAGALFSHIAHAVFDLNIPINQFQGAISDMQLVYRLIEPAGSNLSNALARIETLKREYSQLSALAHKVTSKTPQHVGNLDHLLWQNPFTAEKSHESFVEVFDRALVDYQKTAQLFIAGDMEAVTRGLNYSGIALNEDESAPANPAHIF